MSQICVYRGCKCLQPMRPCRRSIEPTSKTIRVVHLDGFLEEFDGPITVQQIIGNFPKHFITTPIQLMHGLVLLKHDTLLESGRIYFVLPYSILRLNESSKDLICLAKKLTDIAKAHRPKPIRLASSLENKLSEGSNPSPSEFSRDLSLAKKFTSTVRSHRSKPNPAPLASPQATRSNQGSNPHLNDPCSRDLFCLPLNLRSIAKVYWSKPKPKSKPRLSHLASSQERGSSPGSDPSPNEENSNMSKSTKTFTWKPLLSTIREISFNRRESDLRD